MCLNRRLKPGPSGGLDDVGRMIIDRINSLQPKPDGKRNSNVDALVRAKLPVQFGHQTFVQTVCNKALLGR